MFFLILILLLFPCVSHAYQIPEHVRAVHACVAAAQDIILRDGWKNVNHAPQQALQSELDEYMRRKPEEKCCGGNSGFKKDQLHIYFALASLPCVRTFCETGFNAGHSSTAFLAAKPKAYVQIFTQPELAWSLTAQQFWASKFPGQHSFRLGDSSRSVPLWRMGTGDARRCHMIHVDGAHTYEGALSDILNLAPRASPDFNLLLM